MYMQGLFEAEPIQRFSAPLADRHQWKAVKAYLTEQCRLPKALVDRLYQQRLAYANAEGKAVFALRDLEEGGVVGALLYDLATGSRAEQVVLVDSPIEAMSKWVLDQSDTRPRSYTSVSQWPELPPDWLEQWGEAILAFGRQVAADLIELDAGRRVLPQGESWNQDLQDNWQQQFGKVRRWQRNIREQQASIDLD
jgi:hypothetical protein